MSSPGSSRLGGSNPGSSGTSDRPSSGRAQQVDRNPIGHHCNVAGQAPITTPCPEPRIVVLKQPQKDGLPAVVAILLTDPEPPKNPDHDRAISIDELVQPHQAGRHDLFNEPAFVDVLGQGPRL